MDLMNLADNISTDISNEAVEYDKYDNDQYYDYIALELAREFGNKLAFKGGYMLTKIMTETARRTVDVDLSILSDEVYDDIRSRLTAICEKFLSEGVIDRYEVKPEVKPFMAGGVSMYKDNIKIMGVDVGWHDLSYGVTVHDTSIGGIRGFEIERMLADKISAILTKKRFRRAKDLYDLYSITNSFDADLNKILKYMLCRSTKSGVPVEWDNFPFTEIIIREYKKAYTALKVESVYLDRVLEKPAFEDAYERFGNFVVRLKAGSNYKWEHSLSRFKEV